MFITSLSCVAAETRDTPLPDLSGTIAEAIRQTDAADDPETVAALRAWGQPGLDALIRASMLHAGSEPIPGGPVESKTHRVHNTRLIDAVAAQRDAHASGLFWHTDLDDAIAEAQRTGQPILSLRLLGRLDTDLSCANSRFFRTVLYADTALSEKLRDEFVLHWQTVRPVPVITIDMGDGRKIERTITGNSAHYVLDPQGRVVDVLPGLYAPRTFEHLIERAGDVAEKVADFDDASHTRIMARWHVMWLRSLDLQRGFWDIKREPAAADVEPLLDLTISKTLVEAPLVWEAVGKTSLEFDDQNWQKLAAHYAEGSRLDVGSRRLIQAKMPAEKANELTSSKRIVETPFMRTLRNLEQSIALDTARNEHDLHRRAHAWFAAGENLDDLEALNARVYAELFLMPDDDPWLGLVPEDTYAALDGGGLSLSYTNPRKYEGKK